MLGATWRIFGFVVVKFHGRDNLDHPERFLTHHCAGEFLAGNIRFNKHPLAEGPIRARQFLRRMLVIFAHYENTDAGPPGTGTPAALSTVLAMSFCIAKAEASTPE